MKKLRQWLIGALLIAGAAPAAHAQWAVVDVGAIVQLVQQVQTMRDQLETARSQLTEAQAAYQSMTGPRGMDRLLANTVRNYLPADWAALDAALRQAGGGALGRDINALAAQNAVLSAQRVAALSPEEHAQLEAARRSAAMMQVTSRQALANTSQRFASLQELVDAIGGAQDQKAVLDLTARSTGELAMIGNEQNKLLALFQAQHAEELARKQRTREQAIAGIGSLRRLPPLGLNP
jgi:type IV secretion system protein VirB5